MMSYHRRYNFSERDLLRVAWNGVGHGILSKLMFCGRLTLRALAGLPKNRQLATHEAEAAMLNRRSLILSLAAALTLLPLNSLAEQGIIYCYGLIEKYEAGIDTKPDFSKAPGGEVFRTYDDAWQFLVDRNTTDVRRVYGVLADWDADTTPVPGKVGRKLNRWAKIIRVEVPALAP